jgi:uroporphyrin-III C-methyltransferase / precorrin-2 dehydrogenase / sirohydrochlorin ferrochelatase
MATADDQPAPPGPAAGRPGRTHDLPGRGEPGPQQGGAVVGGPYLLGLRLAGRRVVVVGGGAVADRRVPALVRAEADVVLVSPSVTAGLEGLAVAGQIRWERRPYARGDVSGAWLVQACTSDTAVNDAIAADCEAAQIWCVRADDQASSAAWTPAAGEVGDAHVAVLTGDPRRSAGIRDAVVGRLRDGTIGARRGRGAKLRGVALVGGGPGDPGLITVRGRQLLSEADVVITDRLAPRALLAELPPDVEIIDASKIPYGRAMAQEHINKALVSHALAGRFVVRLKGGDPFVFGRGAEEVLACLRAGVPISVVPGVTSAIAAPAAAFVPVTHRRVAQEFHVVSAHVASGAERSSVDWAAIARSSGTIVLLMAVERLDAIAEALIHHGRASSTPVSVIQDGTLPTQHTLTATLGTVAAQAAAAGIRPPAVVVVGEVVNIAAEIEQLLPGRQRWIGRA